MTQYIIISQKPHNDGRVDCISSMFFLFAVCLSIFGCVVIICSVCVICLWFVYLYVFLSCWTAQSKNSFQNLRQVFS